MAYKEAFVRIAAELLYSYKLWILLLDIVQFGSFNSDKIICQIIKSTGFTKIGKTIS